MHPNKSRRALLSRRAFLKNSALLTLGSSSFSSVLGGLQMVNAQSLPVTDYKALVCVFLLGGNDAFNMLVPRSTSEYNTYASTRLSLAVDQAALLPINPQTSDGADYGLHPEMPEIQSLFENGNLAFLANVGALLEPVSRSDFQNNSVPLPPQLFSHNDQQDFVMSLQANKPLQGWASRMADLLVSANPNQNLSMNITMTGANTWQAGGMSLPYSLTAEGVPLLFGIDENDPDFLTQLRTQTFNQLLNIDNDHLFVTEYSRVQTRARTLGAEIFTALEQHPEPNTPFDAQSRLAANLKMVARMIAARDTLGMNRQLFFVGIGDYDTHGDQLNRHPQLLRELSQSLSAFYSALQELGVENQVTTFTASDFGRTLTSNGDGTDHGWGGHQLVMGGAVNGREIYGTMPDLAIGSNDDIGEGRIIPTTAMDQYAATLARWYGLSSSEVGDIFVNLGNFDTDDLGFMGV